MRTPASGGDLAGAVRRAAEEVVRGSGITLDLDLVGEPRPVSPECAAAILSVVREAAHNAVKHSCGRRIRVELAYRPRFVRARVTDDGRGFEVSSDFESYGGHLGLLGLRERASRVGGRLRVRSAPGQGTMVALVARG